MNNQQQRTARISRLSYLYFFPFLMLVLSSGQLATTAKAQDSHTIPPYASAFRNLDGADDWQWRHDPGTPGDSWGSTGFPHSEPSLNGSARQFYVSYSDHGGEIYHAHFGYNATDTHFVYDTYVYIDDPSQLENLEMDMNQTMADGRTVIFGTQCASGSGTWEFTTASHGGSHWHPSNIPCDVRGWGAHTWHHVQIASHRDGDGNVTYDWVNLDGKYSDFKGANGNSALWLRWPAGDCILNFQLDGSSKDGGSITAYTNKMTIYRW